MQLTAVNCRCRRKSLFLQMRGSFHYPSPSSLCFMILYKSHICHFEVGMLFINGGISIVVWHFQWLSSVQGRGGRVWFVSKVGTLTACLLTECHVHSQDVLELCRFCWVCYDIMVSVGDGQKQQIVYLVIVLQAVKMLRPVVNVFMTATTQLFTYAMFLMHS